MLPQDFTVTSFPGLVSSWKDQMAAWPANTPYTLVNNVVLPSTEDAEAFLKLWESIAGKMRNQPGFPSAQMYRAYPDKEGQSNVFVMVAVWESVAAYKAAGQMPELADAIKALPKGTTEYLLMATKISEPGSCTASE
ncbi:hypothetical protein PV08_01739 [Exophiala spinifera]|uniref:ABM domain-containing protein n=1 Tax=Exophiala spinifera TaxID=91928 RepID=A0A0D2CCD8_9EURO|nr:uncharacterized protein PV08_01739 [Exophiala spinifera]KIW21159.1 hypothetical protein PV08_01739 [Exophiala spinifera]